MPRAYLFLAVIACVAVDSSAAPQTVPAKDGSVLRATDELAAAVRARDRDALLRLVALDGVPCTDGVLSRQELRKQLRANGTWLGAYLFAPDVFREKFADPLTPISFAEFLDTARDPHVRVSGKQDRRRTCVRFIAPNMEWAPEFCFRWVRGRWVLGDVPSCG
jgi:hypothetical protein